MKQGLKADQAAALVEMTAAKCSTVKYDIELAEEYIARQVEIHNPVIASLLIDDYTKYF